MNKIIIFGTNQLAELADYYINNDTNLEIVAFTVHKKFKNIEFFKDKPVIEFEK